MATIITAMTVTTATNKSGSASHQRYLLSVVGRPWGLPHYRAVWRTLFGSAPAATAVAPPKTLKLVVRKGVRTLDLASGRLTCSLIGISEGGFYYTCSPFGFLEGEKRFP